MCVCVCVRRMTSYHVLQSPFWNSMMKTCHPPPHEIFQQSLLLLFLCHRSNVRVEADLARRRTLVRLKQSRNAIILSLEFKSILEFEGQHFPHVHARPRPPTPVCWLRKETQTCLHLAFPCKIASAPNWSDHSVPSEAAIPTSSDGSAWGNLRRFFMNREKREEIWGGQNLRVPVPLWPS